MIWSSWHCTAVFICNDAAVSSLVVLFSVNLIRPVFSTLSWDSSLFVSCFPPKQSFRVVVAFWCHRHYQQVFELCVNQHKHFDDTVLLSLVMELNWVVEETGQCFASRWRLGFRETTWHQLTSESRLCKKVYTNYVVQNDQPCGMTVHSSVLSLWMQWETSRKYGASIVKTSRLSASMPWPWRTWPTTTGRINARARDASSGAAGTAVDGYCLETDLVLFRAFHIWNG